MKKNWSFVIYNNKLCCVYKWFPLQIGKIDYITNKLIIVKINYKVPEYFKNTSSSTSGYIKNDEIWFVLHRKKKKKISSPKYIFRNYQHFFAIFDLDMNLLRYSEFFKLGGDDIEFCNGLIVKDSVIILSYSLSDKQSIISEYNIEYINTKIKWYINKRLLT